ncbi:MAG: ABC transporter substrate-binding protein [Devosia sp.]
MKTLSNLAVLLAVGVLGAAPAVAKDVVTYASPMFAEPGRGELLEAWLAKFNASQSDVEVEAVAIPYSSFAKTVFTQMGGGHGPDLMRMSLSDYYSAVEAGSLAEITLDQTYPFKGPDEYLQVDGKRFGVLWELSGYGLIYNPDLLVGEPPKTFEEFLAAAKASTKDGNFGYAYRTTEAESNGMWSDLNNYVYGFGGRWTDGKLPTLDSPEVIAGVAAYREVYNANVIPKGADAATYRRMFWEGKVAMEIDNGAAATILATQGKGIKIGVAPPPFPNLAPGIILEALVLNQNSTVKDAAHTFIKWTLEPEQQQELQVILGGTSVGTLIQRSPEALAERPWLATYDELTSKGIPTLPAGLETKSPDFQRIVIQQVLKLLYSGGDVAEGMAEAQNEAMALVK